MTDRETILIIKQAPSGPLEPGEARAHSWKLVRDLDKFKILVSQSSDIGRRRTAVPIERQTAEEWLRSLRSITVSLMPEVPGSCDGSHYTFAFQGNLVGLELSWYNIPPAGAEQLEDFTEWLWSLVPDDWETYGTNDDPWNCELHRMP